MSRFLEYLLIAICIAVLLVISRWVGTLAYTWMPPQATAEAQKVDQIFSFLTSVGTFVLLGLVGMMLYSVVFFRASKHDYSEGHPSRGDVRLEIIWTVTPTLLVLWIAFQGFKIYQQLDILNLGPIVHLHLEEPVLAQTVPTQNEAKGASLTVDVFAKQWEWSFRYPNNVTSNELHLPVNRKTRLNLNAQEVIHGFYVPEFRLKQDIVPKRDIDIVITPIREGRYTLKDSQFSGTYFALMEAPVYVESFEKYNQWLNGTTNKSITIKNQAVAEYTEPPHTLFKSGWYTVAPVQPSIATERNINNDT